MAIFTNQASLIIGDSVTNSNITEGEVVTGINITKRALTGTYRAGDTVSYIVTVSSASGGALSGLTLTDNLGEYTPVGATAPVVPLEYIDGSLIYLVDGIEQPAPTVIAGPPLTVSGLEAGAGSVIDILYSARVGAAAPLGTGDSIVNTAQVTGAGLDTESASAVITAQSTAAVTIAKALSPVTVGPDGIITYTFIVQNTGNLPITATDGAVIQDSFTPPLSDIEVTLDGVALAEGTGYTYDGATGEFRTEGGILTVPAASYTQDALGNTVTTPGVAVLTVTGRI
ncbi:MAG: hypothetical protein J6L90_04285 [Clostridia bacterium]|nr:hypothetical protein [Clostridia bacterium]